MMTYEDKINRLLMTIVMLLVLCFGIFVGCGLYLTALALLIGHFAGTIAGYAVMSLKIEKEKHSHES